MKRMVMMLCLSVVTALAAAAPVGCNQQLTSGLALLCPDCYQHYKALQGN